MRSLPPRSLMLLAALAACSAPSSGATGEWTGQVGGPHGETIEITLSLQAHADGLTGTVVGPPPLDAGSILEHGRVSGDSLTFDVSAKDDEGTPSTFSFAVAVAGGLMRGMITRSGGGPSFPFTATRTAAKPQAARPSAGDAARRPADLHGAAPIPREAHEAILAAFDRYAVVALGAWSYGNRDYVDFVLSLLRDPALPGTVNDIVVECGNARYQPVLDRYVAGAAVPLAEVRAVWRNTTQPMCGVNALSEALAPLVRRLNESLPPARKLRVLAGDPPVDWSRIRRADDSEPLDRDSSIASVMEREVLAKHRKALMIFGFRHLLHGGGGAVARYEREGHPDATFVVLTHNGFGGDTPAGADNTALERRMATWGVPSLVVLRGTWLDDLEFREFVPDEHGGGRIASRADAYLYLGPRDLLLHEPIPADVMLDTSYQTELARRYALRGRPGPMGMLLEEASDTNTFFYEPHGGAPGRGDARHVRAARRP